MFSPQLRRLVVAVAGLLSIPILRPKTQEALAVLVAVAAALLAGQVVLADLETQAATLADLGKTLATVAAVVAVVLLLPVFLAVRQETAVMVLHRLFLDLPLLTLAAVAVALTLVLLALAELAAAVLDRLTLTVTQEPRTLAAVAGAQTDRQTKTVETADQAL